MIALAVDPVPWSNTLALLGLFALIAFIAWVSLR